MNNTDVFAELAKVHTSGVTEDNHTSEETDRALRVNSDELTFATQYRLNQLERLET